MLYETLPCAVLIAYYHCTVFRDQDISIRELLEFHRYFGPLHKHATTGIPREPGLEEVHGALSTPCMCGFSAS